MQTSPLNLDLRDACWIAKASTFPGANADYWANEARAYTLKSVGTDPFGFHAEPDPIDADTMQALTGQEWPPEAMVKLRECWGEA